MSNKIVFMGTPMFAVPILKSLYQNGYFVSEVYTQPPQKSQRGQKINKSPVQSMAETLNLNFRTPDSLKNNFEKYGTKFTTLIQSSNYDYYSSKKNFLGL